MHGSRRRFLPIVVLLAVIGAGVYFFLQTSADSGGLTVSGTIEATEVNLGSVTGGRVDQVNVQEGDHVEADAVVAVVNGGGSGRGSGGREMIHTPLGGVVLYRHVEPGEIASAGAPLLTLIDPDNLRIDGVRTGGSLWARRTRPGTADHRWTRSRARRFRAR